MPASRFGRQRAAAGCGAVNAPRLSLVVLPFNNLGGEGVSDDIVDGITEDLTTDLSRLPDFLVIARNSAFTYKGKPIDIKRVGEELGVRYAVEGSVRKAGSTLRVNVQLVSTETGTHLWADRFDVGRDGVGYDVDDIVRQIGTSLNVRSSTSKAHAAHASGRRTQMSPTSCCAPVRSTTCLRTRKNKPRSWHSTSGPLNSTRLQARPWLDWLKLSWIASPAPMTRLLRRSFAGQRN